MKETTLFETLHAEFSLMVYQMCLGFTRGDKDKANDLTQEIFINVWNALDKFRGESSHRTWIYRITVNTCLQTIRREKSQPTVRVDEDLNIEDPAPETDHVPALYKAIGKLEEIDRLLIMMVLEDTGYDEIAKVIGITETNLRVRIHRIKKRLKELMQYA